MIRIILVACAAFLPLPVFAAPLTPASKPATQKATPKQIVKTLENSVRFAVPADWNETARSEDGKTISFTSPDEVGVVTVQVVPQEFPLPQKSVSFREKVKTALLRDIKAAMVNRGHEIIYGPRSETDDRFFQRIHTRAKEGDTMLDTLHLYRGAALDLLVVTSIAKTDKPADAAKIHTIAEDICVSITVGSAEKEKK